MAKFIALHGLKGLCVPRIERDENGKIIRDESVQFNKGQKTAKGIVPAYLSISDESTVAFLRAYKGNEANGGKSFKEVAQEEVAAPKKAVAKAEAKPKAAPVAEVVVAPEPAEEEAAPVEEQEEVSEESEVKVFADITTNQEAFAILKSMDDSVSTAKIRNKTQINAKAAELNVSFPNL